MSVELVLLCEASREVGLGHFRRMHTAMLLLNQSKLNYTTRLVVVGDRNSLITTLYPDIEFFNSATDAFVDFVVTKPKLICIDIFPVENPGDVLEKSLNRFRETGGSIMVLDGPAGLLRQADLIFTPNCLPPQNIENLAIHSKVVFGWDCYLLASQSAPQSRVDHWFDLLVLTGGSDTGGLGAVLPGLLEGKLPAKTKIKWVKGPFADSPELPKNSSICFDVIVAPTEISALMKSARIAITVFGISFFELVVLQIPTVVFSPYGSRDTRELEMIKKRGLALVASSIEELVDLTDELLNDRALRETLVRQMSAINISGCAFAREVGNLLCQSAQKGGKRSIDC